MEKEREPVVDPVLSDIKRLAVTAYWLLEKAQWSLDISNTANAITEAKIQMDRIAGLCHGISLEEWDRRFKGTVK